MGKVIFSISYEVIPEKRSEYLELMSKIRDQIKEMTGQEYTVYEDAERPNLMNEVFYLESSTDFEKVKDFQKEWEIELLDRIDLFLVDQEQVAIRTFKEVL